MLKIRFSGELAVETAVVGKVSVVTDGEIPWLAVIPVPRSVAVIFTTVEVPA